MSTAVSLPQPQLDKPRMHGIRVAGQEFELFTESQPLIESMLADIRAATRRVWLETYIYSVDAAGRAVGEALQDRARAGVEVKLIYDALGSWSAPASFFDELRQAGVQVHAFHTFWEGVSRFALFQVLNRRNHRKLLIVDDRVAYFGGMNIVDLSGVTTVAEAKERNLAPSAGWRDVHARTIGDKQREVARAFDRLWRHVRRRPFDRAPWPMRQMLATQGDGVYFFDGRPRWRRSHRRVFLPLIRRAQREITIAMAYFLPTGRVQRALYRARRRGVRVRVIVPAESDVPTVQRATRHLYTRLLRHGIEVYERQNQMLHSKVMVVDGRTVVLGSCNLDPRSLWWNLEFAAVVHSAAMADAVERICQFEIDNSRRVTREDCRQRSFWQRLLDRMSYGLRRWL
jgi:cardiolipin synthase